jgi:hypothetical protein
MKDLIIKLEDNLHARLKIHCVKIKTSMADFIRDHIDVETDYLKEMVEGGENG